MKRQRFTAHLELGHKGSAVIVPFDPAAVWDVPAARLPHPRYRTGHLVKGTLNRVAFDGFIGHRWGRFFILVEDDVQRAAGISPGDLVDVDIRPVTPPVDTRLASSPPGPRGRAAPGRATARTPSTGARRRGRKAR